MIKNKEDFNPRTPCGVRHPRFRGHARRRHFNPRTPCGVRRYINRYARYIDRFQSTHPLRGATGCHLVYDWRCQGHFNPRTPCGVRPLHQPLRPVHRHISIHAPLAGCDSDRNTPSSADMHFNPRTPCGVRPAYIRMLIAQDAISIHAPLAGCDLFLLSSIEIGSISIHAPLAGCDSRPRRGIRASGNFNPRTPCGVRLYGSLQYDHGLAISIHAPLAGCDACGQPLRLRQGLFQSTHPLRGAT